MNSVSGPTPGEGAKMLELMNSVLDSRTKREAKGKQFDVHKKRQLKQFNKQFPNPNEDKKGKTVVSTEKDDRPLV
jgi:hypothetical protein